MGDPKPLALEKFGFFDELIFIRPHKYIPHSFFDFNHNAHRGRQMLSCGSKSRSATESGYFSCFERVFNGEDDRNPQQLYLHEKMNKRRKNIARPFYFSFPKYIPPPAFSSKSISTLHKLTPSHQKSPFRIPNPPKKGTGSGFVTVTIGKYPSAMTGLSEVDKSQKSEFKKLEEPFYLPSCSGYFDKNPYKEYKRSSSTRPLLPQKKETILSRPWLSPGKGKKLGLMKDGCFSPFSSFGNQEFQSPAFYRHSEEVKRRQINPNFVRSIAPKSTLTPSIVQKQIKRSVNAVTYKNMTTKF